MDSSYEYDRDSYNFERETYQRPIGDVISDLFRDGSDLVRQEIALAKAEMREKVSSLVKDGVGIAIGASLSMVGMLALVAAAILALALVLPAWASALIVGGVLALIGLIVLMSSISAMKNTGLAPEKTIETLREDARMVKEKFS